jgi:predicted GNAT superfamily acetyltransferase
MRAAAIGYRSLRTRDDCESVVALEREIWGPRYDEAIPVAILVVTVARGAILIGAFDDDRLVGFVYSLSATKDGKPIQWSYKLGVVKPFRNAGVGERLKLLQRERALEMGIDVIEWTFDPMLGANAHLNLTKLGAVVQEYREDLYGDSLAPVTHRSVPTDRFVVAWHLRDPHVERRVVPSVLSNLTGEDGTAPSPIDGAVPVNRTTLRGHGLECGEIALDIDTGRLMVEIPIDFSDMILRAPDVALAWRLSSRRIFTTYFAMGYGAVEFVLDRPNRKGAYLLVKNADRQAVDDTRALAPAAALTLV